MILVKISEEGKNTFVIVSGHSGVATKGKDILCAAVSALAQGAVIGLQNVLKKKTIIKKSDGYLYFEVAKNAETDILIETFKEAIKDLARQYPKHLKMEE
ncbi:MAG TPA: ribosomal-processing cysteine protease Prp [Clostridia bacterium]|jgi:hypothetical protein|nr:ribosomal-processing cysteine protease Prp [Clostridia bacterium]